MVHYSAPVTHLIPLVTYYMYIWTHTHTQFVVTPSIKDHWLTFFHCDGFTENSSFRLLQSHYTYIYVYVQHTYVYCNSIRVCTLYSHLLMSSHQHTTGLMVHIYMMSTHGGWMYLKHSSSVLAVFVAEVGNNWSNKLRLQNVFKLYMYMYIQNTHTTITCTLFDYRHTYIV